MTTKNGISYFEHSQEGWLHYILGIQGVNGCYTARSKGMKLTLQTQDTPSANHVMISHCFGSLMVRAHLQQHFDHSPPIREAFHPTSIQVMLI